MSLDVRLWRPDRVYRPGEKLQGFVIITSKGTFEHKGITLSFEGAVHMTAKMDIGLFDALGQSLKPIPLISSTIQLAKPATLPDGVSEIPFEFSVESLPNATLFDTYHGAYVDVSYTIKCDVLRPFLRSDLSKVTKFLVEVLLPKGQQSSVSSDEKERRVVDGKYNFVLTPEHKGLRFAPGEAQAEKRLFGTHNDPEDVDRPSDWAEKQHKSRPPAPSFRVAGVLDTARCDLLRPLTGHITVEESTIEIRAIELQLVRIESVLAENGQMISEATGIQTVQVADGYPALNVPVPLHMVFPRLFTCPTVVNRHFKVEFEVYVHVFFVNDYAVTEKIPLRLSRSFPSTHVF